VARGLLEVRGRHGFTRHPEIETYTWELLPEELKINLAGFLERESI
jgi:hypothetical protein